MGGLWLVPSSIRELSPLTSCLDGCPAAPRYSAPAGGVSFPVPLYPLVQPGVLVETFEGGTHISAYVAK
jgi:hypothetical protein